MEPGPLVAAIFKGKILDNSLKEKITDFIARWIARIKSINSTSENKATFFQRIQTAKKAFDEEALHALLEPYKSRLDKNSDLSILLREKGNELYKNRNTDGALRAYTLALAFAPTSTAVGVNEELLLAYVNRSSVLLQKNLVDEALKDIQKALDILEEGDCKAVPHLKEKLHQRQIVCANARKLNVQKQENVWGHKLFQLQNPGTSILTAESFVDIKYSTERGRHLIVTRDVQAGSVLLKDVPFVHVLNNLLGWETEHCHNCSRRTFNSIPCKSCSFALFCSENCRDSACHYAKGIHYLEHGYLSILHHLDSPHGDIQCLRLLARTNHNEIKEVSKYLSSSVACNNKNPIGFDSKGGYDTSSYLPIFHLISHPPSQNENAESDEALKNAVNAVILTFTLKLYSNYFEKSNEAEFEDLIAALILKHMESIKYNAISQSKLVHSGVNKQSAVAYAAAVYPLISLCNHSCDPNCAPVKQATHLTTSLVALKHLREGEELFITYKPLYTQLKTRERQKFLAERYRFICTCQACEENWGPGKLSQQDHSGPSPDGALLILEPTLCEKCNKNQSYDGSGKGKQCQECALIDLERAREIKKIEKTLFECHDLLMGDEKEDEAENQHHDEMCFKRLPEAIDFFGRHAFPTYFPLYNVALDLFKRALVKSVAHL